MKAIYKFEEELLKEYDFEPMNEGYNIDELKETDREQLSGMLWVLYSTIQSWDSYCETEREAYPETMKKLSEELFEKNKENFIQCLLSDIQEFVISALDSYEE